MKEKAEFEVLRNDIWQSIDIKNLKINDVVRYKNYPETTYTITNEYFVHENNVGAVIGIENVILYMEAISES